MVATWLLVLLHAPSASFDGHVGSAGCPVPFAPDSLSPLGLHFALCSWSHHTYIHSVSGAPPSERLCAFWPQHDESYVASFGGLHIFSLPNLVATIDCLLALTPVPPSVQVVLVPEHHSSFDNWPPPLHLHLQVLCHGCALQMVSGEGVTLNQCCFAIDGFALDMSEVKRSKVIHHLQPAAMTPEERA